MGLGHHVLASAPGSPRVLRANLDFWILLKVYRSKEEGGMYLIQQRVCLASFVTFKYSDGWYMDYVLYACPSPCKY